MLKYRNNKYLCIMLSILFSSYVFFSFCLPGALPVYAVTYSETCYEAESATLNGVSTNTNHTGYTGTGFVDGFGDSGDYVQFSISVASAGDYSLIFRYANDTGYKASRKVYVDNVYQAMAVFPDLAGWDTWGTGEIGITSLSSGAHTVKIEFNNYTINLDNLVVEVKHESVRSLYLSNWDDMMAIWKASKLCSEDTAVKGPRIDELRYSGSWSVNQIKDYSGFFRDETNSNKYIDYKKFDSEAYFDENGVLKTNYLKYNGAYPEDMEISRDYVMVPNENFIVARYALKNTGASSITMNVLDMLHANNTTQNNVSASYDSARRALIVNMSNASQPYLALGAFSTPTGYQVANDTISNPSTANCSPWYTFDNDGTLRGDSSVTAADVSVAFNQSVAVAASSTEYVYFYIALGASSNDINSICDTARAQTGAYWFTQTASAYSTWFGNAKSVPDFADNDLELVYKRNLAMIKNCTRPGTSTGDGAMPATTNPYDYSYKIWTRDSAVTAFMLDAAGFTTEGERYWRWLAARQLTGDDEGQFNTCIDIWTNQRVEFIEPEHDILGWFLYGVYRHCEEVGSNTLRDNLWTQITASADFIMDNIDTDGFGPEDFSIWEDMDNYGNYAYTQALYAAGLEAAAIMAGEKGLPSLADSYNGAASALKSAINSDDTGSKGFWNPSLGYFDRNIKYDGSLNILKDTSTLILMALGIIDTESSRASGTVESLEADLASDDYGLGRYGNDTYYTGDSNYSPSGDEALELSPSWPQMSCWNAVYQVYAGNSSKALNILNWYKHRTAAGFMVTGEAVSDVSEKPCVSTSSEPVTAAAYILACLTYDGDIDMRIIPSQSNAGCYKAITVSSGCTGDWPQYEYVPYYLDERGDSTDTSQTGVKNVYVANDGTNLYLRIDNESGTLPSYNDPTNLFQVSVYCEDHESYDPTTTNSINSTALGRNMAYLYKRNSDSTSFEKYDVSGGSWVYDKTLASGAVEWETTSGRLEIKIPLSEIGSSTPVQDDWANMVVILAKKISGVWTDTDLFDIHCRYTGSTQSWIYGDFE